ncbi:MAG: chemotaxis protein CheW [Nitrospirae bacterium]|nr:MAG: chemotaxis protein CheW [Nitrospirota bacterium]
MSSLQWKPALSVEDQKKVLKARAQALAKVAASEDPGLERIEIIEFLLAHERYGLETRYISEVYPLKYLTPLPCTPSFVVGVVNVRGRIVSVLDLKVFFELPHKGLTDLDKVIILNNDTMEFGILADAVLGARLLPVRELQPSLPTLTEVRAEYLKGVTEDRLVVLDAEKILSDKKIIVHEEV